MLVKAIGTSFSENINNVDAESRRCESLCHVSGSEIRTSLMGQESDTGLLMKLGQRNAAWGVLVCRNEIMCNIRKLLLTKFRRDKKAI